MIKFVDIFFQWVCGTKNGKNKNYILFYKIIQIIMIIDAIWVEQNIHNIHF